ncbi:hypothetical protein N7457_005364 [Penicillium paradoxum]|uniref:uncharacterized protein n=1 Tax=Penicillium paradoxum TaxID=176176 RepID=UPI0025466E2F|nr:uncharacterized protein N7457_005364 [Penicillium paradoxum]KAJ5780204.1 hypothetical protein N7457_005364 [Penicillium paradoxum]
MFFTICLGLFIVFGACVLTVLRRKRQTLPLPPGPRPTPIFGNLKDLPTVDGQEWLHWLKHKELYGPISSLNVFGNNLIIINDAELAVRLLEKRSGIHSSRPRLVFAEMSGWHSILGALRDATIVRKTRKLMHQEIGTKSSMARFNDVQATEVSRFLMRVLDKPEELQRHIKTEAGSVILKIAYGYNVEPHDHDPLVDMADKAMGDFSMAMQSTRAVEFLPFLQYLPSWFPGAGFVGIAKDYKATAEAFSGTPYAFVKRQMSIGQSRPSFLSNLLRNNPVEPGTKEENMIEWSAAALYGGGADTTVSSLSSFFQAMALFPDTQRKAQQELDAVLGPNQIPKLQDRERLPYMDALIKEVFRWHPVVPVSLPHTSIEDDTFEGYFIPKGAAIIANIWAYTHDVDIYHDPMTFKPERFLATPDGHIPERDPRGLVFGFGRRICPGRLLADSNIFLTVAQALAVFDISKPIQDGVPQEIPIKFLPGVISHPAPFELSIQPRSAAHRQLILSLEQLYPWEKSDAEHLASV